MLKKTIGSHILLDTLVRAIDKNTTDGKQMSVGLTTVLIGNLLSDSPQPVEAIIKNYVNDDLVTHTLMLDIKNPLASIMHQLATIKSVSKINTYRVTNTGLYINE